MNAKRTSNDGSMDTPTEKAVEDLVRASAEAMEFALKGDWAKDIDPAAPPVHPLMAHPTAMMAAATVVGMGVTSQVAGMWLGFMKGFSEARESGADAGSAPEVESSSEEKSMPLRAGSTSRESLRVVVDNEKVLAAEPKRVADDLKQIAGIGPKLAAVLADRGLKTFADIASLNEAQLAALDAELGLDGRVERDNWSGQAKALLEDAS
ncbi:MAG: helix-hairpin-helix domain-containing protein [Gammaproteobacteria bacterium]